MDRQGRLFLLAVGVALVSTAALAGFASHQPVYRPRHRPVIPEICLGCICEATSNCTMSIGCTQDLCGPFLISLGYWVDAGSPVLPGDHRYRSGAYYDCVTDPYCAAQTVQGYVDRYFQDCNRDGYISCDDFGRLHYLGRGQCNIPLEHTGYYRVFQECNSHALSLNG